MAAVSQWPLKAHRTAGSPREAKVKDPSVPALIAATGLAVHAVVLVAVDRVEDAHGSEPGRAVR